jgi:hypothetical protein
MAEITSVIFLQPSKFPNYKLQATCLLALPTKATLLCLDSL